MMTIIGCAEKARPVFEKGKWQVEQHVISFLIELVRVYAGKQWRPVRAKLHSDCVDGIAQSAYL